VTSIVTSPRLRRPYTCLGPQVCLPALQLSLLAVHTDMRHLTNWRWVISLLWATAACFVGTYWHAQLAAIPKLLLMWLTFPCAGPGCLRPSACGPSSSSWDLHAGHSCVRRVTLGAWGSMRWCCAPTIQASLHQWCSRRPWVSGLVVLFGSGSPSVVAHRQYVRHAGLVGSQSSRSYADRKGPVVFCACLHQARQHKVTITRLCIYVPAGPKAAPIGMLATVALYFQQLPVSELLMEAHGLSQRAAPRGMKAHDDDELQPVSPTETGDAQPMSSVEQQGSIAGPPSVRQSAQPSRHLSAGAFISRLGKVRHDVHCIS
jgi:hypothetical protein